jgi:hypothetical protein
MFQNYFEKILNILNLFSYFKLFFYIFSDYFDVLILKIFFKNKKILF